MRDRKHDAVERSTTSLLVLGAIVLVGIVLWKAVEWHRMASGLGEKDRIQMEAEVLKTVAQILGGGGLLAGLYFTWKNVQVLHEGQITERFTRSIEHLGSDKLEVRLGGVYALGRIARDSKRDQPLITSILCAYIREHARWEGNRAPTKLPCDIQAALTLLGSQTWVRNPTRPWLDLSGTDLRGVDLCWAHLEAAIFKGSHLEGARLVEAHLEGAFFTDANVTGADLTGACLDDADLEGVVGLTEEQLDGAKISAATRLPKYLPSGQTPGLRPEYGRRA
jgi:hypothetical protein